MVLQTLYKQEIDNFDHLYPTLKSHEIQVIIIAHSEMKNRVLSQQLKGRLRCKDIHKGSQIFQELSLSICTKKLPKIELKLFINNLVDLKLHK